MRNILQSFLSIIPHNHYYKYENNLLSIFNNTDLISDQNLIKN